MKLEKAIVTKTQHLEGKDPFYLRDLPEADRLLIEAGEHIESLRKGVPRHIVRLLPSETEE